VSARQEGDQREHHWRITNGTSGGGQEIGTTKPRRRSLMSKKLLLLIAFAVLPTQIVFSQHWTEEEMEVWNTILDCDEKLRMMDKEGFLSCFHEDYNYWWANEPVPFRKDSVQKFIDKWMADGNTVVFKDLRPVAIKVWGDFALAHWFLKRIVQYKNGVETTETEQITFMMKKENGKWQYVGGAGPGLKAQGY
jgi:ketosteroid isomerase-like protein